MPKTVLAYSGGLDSFILWILLGQPQCLYVAGGHAYQGRELETILAHRRKLGVNCYISRKINWADFEQEDGHIPYRNDLILTAMSMEFPGATILAYGALSGETSPDKSGAFIRRKSRLMSMQAGHRIRVVAPARHMTKTELVAKYIREGHAVNYLHQTRSCYRPGDLGCGRCMACFRRWVAFTLNDINVDAQFEQAPWEWEQVKLSSAGSWTTYMKSVSIGEYTKVVRNNWQAYQALRRRL